MANIIYHSGMFIEVDYDENIEMACARGDRDLVMFVHDLRQSIKASGAHIPFVVSYRGIQKLAKWTETFGAAEAMKMTIVKGLDKDNIRVLHNGLMNQESKYAKAFKACIRKVNAAMAA